MPDTPASTEEWPSLPTRSFDYGHTEERIAAYASSGVSTWRSSSSNNYGPARLRHFWNQIPADNPTQTSGETMFDIIVTSTDSAPIKTLRECTSGDIVKALDGPYRDQILLIIGSDRYVSLSKMQGTSQRISDSYCTVRALRSNESITLMVR